MRALLLVPLMLLGAARASMAQDSDPIQFLDDTYEIVADADSKVILAPVIAAPKITANSLRTEIIDVARGAEHETAYKHAFHSELSKDFRTLTIGVSLKPALRPGTYLVRVAFLNAQDGTVIERHSLNVKVPAAQLAVPAALVISRVRGLLGGVSLEGDTLVINETSSRSRVNQLTAQQLSVDAPESGPAGLRVDYSAAPAMAPGGQVSLTASPVGAFPLGSVRGKATLTALELETPVSLPFEVKTRITRAALWAVLAAGLVFGYFMRTQLQAIIEISRLRIQAAAVRQRLGEQLSLHPDDPFHAAVAEQDGLLNQAMRRDDAEVLRTAVTRAETVLQEQLHDLRKRTAETQSRIDAVAQALSTQWMLPPAIAADLAHARNEIDAAQKSLNDGKLQAADLQLKAVQPDLLQQLQIHTESWRDKALDVVSELRERGLPAPSKLDSDFDGAAAATQALLKGLLTGAAIEDPTSLLNRLHAARESLTELVRLARRRLGTVVSTVGQQLSQSDKAQLEARLATLDTEMESGDTDPARRLQAIVTAGNELAKLMPQAAQPGSRFLGTVAGATEVVSAQVPLIPHPWWGDFPRATSWLRRATADMQAPPSIEVVQARAWSDLLRAQFAQTFFAGVGILAVGYLVFADNFIGTPKDLLAAFTWAFGIDVGINAFVEKAKAVR
jgi:hypothetical protein